MGKFDGILICTDLDGTLYKNDKTISSVNREAIEYFKSEGGYFTFITGRLPYYSVDAYNAVGPNVPFGCVNGGGVYDGERKEYIFKSPLADGFKDLISFIVDAFPTVGVQVCCFDKTYFAIENQLMADFRAITGLPHYTCDYLTLDEPVGKILFGTYIEEEMIEIEKALRSHPLAYRFDFVRSERTLFEILPKGVHKGVALEKLVSYLGIDISKAVAIGDYNNDVGMLRSAGVGVAVANASPMALEAADFVTVSNEDHAIASVISSIESGEIAL